MKIGYSKYRQKNYNFYTVLFAMQNVISILESGLSVT